jgi:hypothetical protein
MGFWGDFDIEMHEKWAERGVFYTFFFELLVFFKK